MCIYIFQYCDNYIKPYLIEKEHETDRKTIFKFSRINMIIYNTFSI